MDCAQACLRGEECCGGHPVFNACEHACRECFDACILCLADLRDSPRRAVTSCLGCALACEHCADECGRYHGGLLQRCAEACRTCAELCREISARATVGRGA